MRRQILMAVGMSLLLVATLMPGVASAAEPERFGRVDLEKHPIDKDLAAQLRKARDPNRQMMVFIELTRPSVADLVGPRLEAGEVVTDAGRRQLRRPIQQQQAGVKRDIERLNGRVHASFSDVLNGFRATVPTGQMDKLARLTGVRKIWPVSKMQRNNDTSARYMSVPQAWQQTGLTGSGVKIAIIDTGINYKHATFGGDATSTFPTAKVVGGYDFVGDAYDGSNMPIPDPDPMDCHGHGTHVAGTAAGFGVTSDGNTYAGPYNAATVDSTSWNVAPGMAPEALLLAYRVFGCDGSTYVVMDAIEMAVRDGAHVINMSLGLFYGNGGRIEEVATNNAVRAGVVVVASAGNSGPSAYIAGSPSTADGAISVAAMDAVPGYPSVWIDMPTGDDIRAINANGSDELPATGPLNHFEDNPATVGVNEALGCNLADWVYNDFQPGQIAVTYRGVCARVARAEHGQTLGAEAVIMINNADSYPPFEGPIPGVTLPFLGVPSSVAGRFATDDGGTATVTEAPDLSNPAFGYKAAFTSGGYRRDDQLMKPDVIAPGVSVFSADTDNIEGGVGSSGTSMAAPAVAGVAALVRQARPNLIPRWIKSLIVNTATTDNITPKDPRVVGAGVVDALRATTSLAHVTVPNPLDKNEHMFQPSMTFGYRELVRTSSGPVLKAKRSFRIWNRSSKAITYNISNQFATAAKGLKLAISPRRVTVPANTNRLVTVNIKLSPKNARNQLSAAAPGHGPVLGFDEFGQPHLPLEHVAGRLLLTPTSSPAGVMTLRVPWTVVPRATSNVWPRTRSSYTTSGTDALATINVRNNGLRQGFADFFQWGLQDSQEGYRGMDMRAGGVQSLPPSLCWSGASPDDVCLNIAINNWTRFSNASENLWIVPIDTNGDGIDDYEVYGVGAELLLGALPGVFLSAVYDLTLDTWTDGIYLAVAPPNSSTIMLPFLASDIGLGPDGDQDFEYYAVSLAFWDADPGDPGSPALTFDLMFTGNHPGSMVAHYNAWNPALSNGQLVSLNPGARSNVPVWIDLTEYDWRKGHKGWMIVTLDDPAGHRQADLFEAGHVPMLP